MKNSVVDGINRVLIFVFIGLFIWSLWPLPQITQDLHLDQTYIDPELLESCPSLAQFAKARIELAYPLKLWKSEAEAMTLTVEPHQDSDFSGQEASCNLLLDVRLDSDGLGVAPGDRIVLAYSGEIPQTIQFILTPYADDTDGGELWISVDVTDTAGEGSDRVPLFVIPLEFKVVSVLGLPPVLARYICLFMLLLQLVIAFRKRLFK